MNLVMIIFSLLTDILCWSLHAWNKGVTQNPQYSKTAVLKNPYVREICDFYGEIYNYQRGSTSILKDDLDNLDNYLFQEIEIILTTIIF